ncbi:aminoglycoside phosphotransferase family protein [Streptomyces sp. NPDC052225]|uniref:phosphotransferase family protein n=1 Tax=Streptomyces sp. NPDC052225 TaxID=3154949 RepID=UPI003433839D
MLPEVTSDEEWARVVRDEALLRPGLLDLCRRLGLPDAAPVRFADGSVPVYAVDDAHVLKLFPPASAADGVREARVLERLHGRLPVATPELLASGTCENGWRHVLMGRLPGESLALAWPRIPGPDQDRLVDAAGEVLAALHGLDAGPLADVLGPPDWTAFVAGQRAKAVRRQREKGLPEEWCAQIDAFLDRHVPSLGGQPALLHTEFMREHLLVEGDGDSGSGRDTASARLSGLFDFEPAMIGDPVYDFVAVGLFVTRADPRLMSRFAKAYGRAVEPCAAMAYTLLHVYSDLPWYLRELPPSDGVTCLASLAEEWFGAA